LHYWPEPISVLTHEIIGDHIEIEIFFDMLRKRNIAYKLFSSRYLFKEQNGGILRKRGWGNITIDILEATLTPQKKMRIMYRANLNYARFDKYFSSFLEKGFIERIGDRDGKFCYHISQKGKTLLAVLKNANELSFSEEL
jgi:predicted transcriptional regulator